MLKLNTRELPAVEVTVKLPRWLGPGGDCFISFKARAGGSVNPAYVAGIERLRMAAEVGKRRIERIEGDEERVKAEADLVRSLSAGRIGVAYDACVIEWASNIQSDGKPIEPTRESFMALVEADVKPIANAILRLYREVLKAGDDAAQADEDAIKN